MKRRSNASNYHSFQCNICGKISHSPLDVIKAREKPSCYHCGSTLRFRSIIAALSSELTGRVIPLNELSANKSIRGIGMSDTMLYASRLEKKFAYTNTFYHKKPRLDITNPDDRLFNTADFIISSDVLEHVPPPVSTAFENIYRILNKSGVVVFSVPYVNNGNTIEHFPDLYDYRIARRNGNKVLINTTIDGRTQIFDNLQFHGGCGSTLEMRVFSKESLLKDIRNAGFHTITIHDSSIPDFGIIQDEQQAAVISMHKQ